jgi:hypothetical protein
LRDSLRPVRVEIQNPSQHGFALLLQFMVDAGVIAPKRARARYRNPDWRVI